MDFVRYNNQVLIAVITAVTFRRFMVTVNLFCFKEYA